MWGSWWKCTLLKTKTERILPGFLSFYSWTSISLSRGSLLPLWCAAVIPHLHVRGRENITSVVLTWTANQTDYFAISDAYMTADRKLGFLQLRLIYPVFVYISQSDVYRSFTYVDGCSLGGSLLSSITDGVQFMRTLRSSETTCGHALCFSVLQKQFSMQILELTQIPAQL